MTYSSVVAQLQDTIGRHFAKKYTAKYGEGSTPMVGSETYDMCWHYALAAAIAGGSGEPGDFNQNRRVSKNLRYLIYRGVQGVTRYWRDPPEDPLAIPGRHPLSRCDERPVARHASPILPNSGSGEAADRDRALAL